MKQERVLENPRGVKVKRCTRPLGISEKALRRREQHGDE